MKTYAKGFPRHNSIDKHQLHSIHTSQDKYRSKFIPSHRSLSVTNTV